MERDVLHVRTHTHIMARKFLFSFAPFTLVPMHSFTHSDVALAVCRPSWARSSRGSSRTGRLPVPPGRRRKKYDWTTDYKIEPHVYHLGGWVHNMLLCPSHRVPCCHVVRIEIPIYIFAARWKMAMWTRPCINCSFSQGCTLVKVIHSWTCTKVPSLYSGSA